MNRGPGNVRFGLGRLLVLLGVLSGLFAAPAPGADEPPGTYPANPWAPPQPGNGGAQGLAG